MKKKVTESVQPQQEIILKVLRLHHTLKIFHVHTLFPTIQKLKALKLNTLQKIEKGLGWAL